MKKLIKKIAVVFMCICLVQVMAGGAFEPVSVQAAAKKGLVKSGKNYYYYQNGKKIKNKWKTVTVKNSKGKKVSYRYYFGKDGKAYIAKNEKSLGYTKNIVCKKIGKYSYGFDRLGHMVKSGYYNNPDKFDKNNDSLTYYFDSKGHYVASKSKSIRKAGAYGADAGAIRKILGTPEKTVKLNSCFGKDGDDYKLVYGNVYVTIHRYTDNREIVFGIFPM